MLQERDGMRAILESYDSELAPTEYSPQLSKRLREAEDILQKTQSHNAEMEVCLQACINILFFFVFCSLFCFSKLNLKVLTSTKLPTRLLRM